METASLVRCCHNTSVWFGTLKETASSLASAMGQQSNDWRERQGGEKKQAYPSFGQVCLHHLRV